MVSPLNVNNANNTGICTINGRQPAKGLPNSFISFPNSSCCFFGSPENLDLISACLFSLLVERSSFFLHSNGPALKGNSILIQLLMQQLLNHN